VNTGEFGLHADYYLQERGTAKKEVEDMLNSINKGPCFTGEQFNILRVVAAFPLTSNMNSASTHVQAAIKGDGHPLATLNPEVLFAALARFDGTPSIMSTLTVALKRACEDEAADKASQPDAKSRRISGQRRGTSSRGASSSR
jgi:hypothetical protein